MTDCRLFKGNFSNIKRIYRQFNKSRKKEVYIDNSTKYQSELSYDCQNNKVVIFDLDETLGSFSDLYIIWTGISNIITIDNDTINNTILFTNICDLFPEFLRCNILPILAYINEQKKAKKCHKLYIYTNNKCSKQWANQLLDYISNKLISNYHLDANDIIFDKIILAFKINNEYIESLRTTSSKTFDDLIKCTMLPITTEFCFIDDCKHDKMIHDNVYYICPSPFNHNLKRYDIIKKLVLYFNNNTSSINLSSSPLLISQDYWNSWFSLHNSVNDNLHFSYKKECTITLKILQHIKDFFNMTIYKNYNKFNKKTLKSSNKNYK